MGRGWLGLEAAAPSLRLPAVPPPRAAWPRLVRWLGALVLLAALAASVAAAPSVDGIASRLHPPDCASDMSAADCPTQMANQFRAQILADLSKGESEHQIVAAFEQQYGPAVLALPAGPGLGTLAWWLPPIVLVIGAGVASIVVRAWRRRAVVPPGEDPAPGEPKGEIPADVRARM